MSEQIYPVRKKLSRTSFIPLFVFAFLGFFFISFNQATAHAQIKIEKVEEFAMFGNFQNITVNLTNNTNVSGYSSFSLLINYDTTYFTYVYTSPDSLFTASGWELFTATLEAPGFIRIAAVADTDGLAPFPSSHFENQNGSLFRITFRVTSNTSYSYQGNYMQCYWQECDDNYFVSRNGDSLFTVDTVYLHDSPFVDPEPTPDSLPTNLGVPDSCLSVNYPGMLAVRDLTFFADFTECWGSDSAVIFVGDMNLNDIINETADRNILADYFYQGIGVFTINIAEQIARTDVNRNGITLEFKDLVFIQRIISGDTVPAHGFYTVPDSLATDTAIIYHDLSHKTIALNAPNRLAYLGFSLPGINASVIAEYPDSTVMNLSQSLSWQMLFPKTPTGITSGALFKYTGAAQTITGAGGYDYHQLQVPVRIVTSGVAATCDDLNASGDVNIQDIIYMVTFMFNGGPAPLGARDGDVSCDNVLNVLDLIAMINYFFGGSGTSCCLGD